MSRSPVAFGPYIITRRIARGGMAEIYRGRSRGAGDAPSGWVAIKMMRLSLGHEELREHLFRREAKIANMMHHPNVVPLYGFGIESERHYLAMEYIRGRDASHFLKHEEKGQRRTVPFEIALSIGSHAAAGLGYAHRLVGENGRNLGIVHRDVSPGNVMVSYAGEVKILDFGVARINEFEGTRTQTGTLRGKFAYMSPEQTLGEELDARSDVFSLGAVLYELLTGQNAFRAENPLATLERVQQVRPMPPSKVNRSIPQEVDRILARCLAKDKNRRFQDCVVLHEALEEYLEKLGFKGKEELLSYLQEKFFREKIQEAKELKSEEEEVAILDAASLELLRDDVALDAADIAVSLEEEASQSDVVQSSRPLFSERDEHEVFEQENEETVAQQQAKPSSNLLLGVSQKLSKVPSLVNFLPRSQTEVRQRNRFAIWAAGIALLTFVGGALFFQEQNEAGDSEKDRPPKLQAPPLTTLSPVHISLDSKKVEPTQEGTLTNSSTTPKASKLETPKINNLVKPQTIEPRAISPIPLEKNVVAQHPIHAQPHLQKEKKPVKKESAHSTNASVGYLNVAAQPWAEIKIDGKTWPYQTPQAGIELSVGKHVVVLSNRNTGVVRTAIVEIKPGSAKTLNVDMRAER